MIMGVNKGKIAYMNTGPLSDKEKGGFLVAFSYRVEALSLYDGIYTFGSSHVGSGDDCGISGSSESC